MPSAVIGRVNQIGFSEGQPSLLTFYDQKGNPVGYDNKISGVEKSSEITGVDEETDE